MADVSGSQQLAAKAGGRRARVAIFGGSKNKKVGRRGRSGAQFNKGRGSQFAQAQQRTRDAAARALIVPQVSEPDQFADSEDD